MRTEIGKICTLVKGGLNPQKHELSTFAHYSLPAFDIGHGPVIESGAEIHSQKTAIPNDVVLVSKLNPRIPRVWHVKDDQTFPRICSTEFVPLRPDPSVLDAAYLALALRDALEGGVIKGNTAAATKSRERAKPGDFLRLAIELPALDVQRRIVDLLARAENIVRKRREAEQKAKEIIPALFVDMFGDPATNPKGWEIRPLPDVLSESFKNGLYVPKEQYATDRTTQGVEMVHMSDAFYGQVQRGALRRVIAPACDLEPYFLTEHDLLVARRSLNREGAAKLCNIPSSSEPLVFESSFIRLRPNRLCVETDYLYYYLNSPETRSAFLDSRISGITITGINQAALSTVPVMIPDLGTQRRFCERVGRVRSIHASQNGALGASSVAFQALLARAFSVDN